MLPISLKAGIRLTGFTPASGWPGELSKWIAVAQLVISKRHSE